MADLMTYVHRSPVAARITRDEALGAKAVRTEFGWWLVIGVNECSVSVEERDGLDTYRIPFGRILETR